ncbi:MAG: beta-ketoacyl synthase N-terminal-like domain-containing protein, partial [Planctomycetota bacterium]
MKSWTEGLAIIGMAGIFPEAKDLAAYWKNLKEGNDAIREVPSTHWSPEDYLNLDPKAPDHTYTSRGGFLSPLDFDPLQYGIAPNALEATDTSQLLALVAAQRALEDAGYGAGRDFDRSRVSVILGVTGALELVLPLGARLGHPLWRRALKEAGVTPEIAEEVLRRISRGYVGWQEASFPGLLGNVVAGRIANRLDLGGTNCVVDAACASSLSALHLAALELKSGRTDMVITGGIDTFNSIFMYMCFSKTPALSPTGDARPFSKDADGTILGEGVGLLVLKRLAAAEQAGDRIYAVVRGIGSSSDGKGNAIYAPSSEGQIRALNAAYQEAAISPRSIELVEAHGTGTRVGDAVEVKALTDVYRQAEEGTWCALGSVKSQIGHTKAAAGAAGLIKAALALHHQVLPPTIKVKEPILELETQPTPFYLNTEARPWLPRPQHPRRAAVSSFGFGGSNFHCVLEEHPSGVPDVDWDGDVQLLAFSASTPEALQKALESWPELPWSEFRARAASLRESYQGNHPYRLTMVVKRTVLDEVNPREERPWRSARRLLRERGMERSFQTPGGIYFGAGEAAGQLAMLFPGQGAQYPGMLRHLACTFPELREVLSRANDAFWNESELRLSDLIFPPPSFSRDAAEQYRKALQATDVAQPALGAVSLGAFRILQRFGVQPQAVAGHSYGELTALCAAGRLTQTALHVLSNFRGRLMAEGHGDRGTMVA